MEQIQLLMHILQDRRPERTSSMSENLALIMGNIKKELMSYNGVFPWNGCQSKDDLNKILKLCTEIEIAYSYEKIKHAETLIQNEKARIGALKG